MQKGTHNRCVKLIKNSQPFGEMSENRRGIFLTHTVLEGFYVTSRPEKKPREGDNFSRKNQAKLRLPLSCQARPTFIRVTHLGHGKVYRGHTYSHALVLRATNCSHPLSPRPNRSIYRQMLPDNRPYKTSSRSRCCGAFLRVPFQVLMPAFFSKSRRSRLYFATTCASGKRGLYDKMVNGFRYYRALESVSMIASALSTALTIYPCQIRVHQR